MKIEILQLLEGARNATGLTVVIDVFRAFSTACYAVGMGAGPVYPVGDIDEAFELKKKFPEALLVGERHERPPVGFDFGNSPAHLLKAAIAGRPVIHTTSSGTQGLVNATRAREVITGSFVNAGAIVRYIKSKNPEQLSLVCMGYACLYPTDEDTFCAEYIRNELTGKETGWPSMVHRMRHGSGARFFEENSQAWAPAEDFDLCLDRNRFSFVLKAVEESGQLVLQKLEV